MSILFNTKLRRRLLTYSFSHPDEEYYVRELAGIISEDPGNLSRELRKFEKEGLYKSFSKGGLRFYSLNKNYSLFKEIKKIIFKTEGIEGTIRKIVSRYKDITIAFIYGSYAKNKERKTSDVDLILIGSFPVSAFTREIRKLESELNREINFAHYSKEEFDKERQKKGAFLDIVLNNKIIVLKGKLDVNQAY
ncbi:MAG: nucleotidyltransferase domain-containing protein [Candidatus Omnitrophica bacterium]|nr:nucleotidyltransferase domain-containing protein [Candidatus Omnitrophota bacterium]